MKFRKKPIVIEAIQWKGYDKEEIDKFVGKELDYTESDTGLVIHTLEGDMTAYCFDWIIKGIKGEFYPCKPDIFKETYEEESEEDMPIITEKASERKKCPYCNTGRIHKHIVIIDKGIVNYLKSLGEAENGI